MTQLSWCADHVRRFDYDRWLTTLFAPPAEREALSALFAFNVEVARIRETVTEPLLGQIRLQWWRETLDAVFAGRPPRHEVAGALAGAVGRYDLDREPFERLLDARAADLDDAPPRDLAALAAYAKGTSASLMTLALAVLGERGEAARAVGDDVGTAWSMVGLLRAVPFHAAAGRSYLPADAMRAAGVGPTERLARDRPSGLAPVVLQVAEAATTRLAVARERRAEVSKRALPALLPGVLADAYLGRLRTSGWDPFDRRVQEVGKPVRLLRTALAALRNRY